MIRGIEGLRAVLAWWVVVGHVHYLSGIGPVYPRIERFIPDGIWAVDVFVILSGFVITHICIVRQDRYLPYLTRRFFRLYPCYLLCLALGILIMPVSFNTLDLAPWGVTHLPIQIQEYEQHFWQHVLAHLTLLHGTIPSQILPQSQLMFLPPAWSLSLEWQFYVIAPGLLFLLGHRNLRAPCLLLILGVSWLYWHGRLGIYEMPSTLPASASYFLVGITSRMYLDKFKSINNFPWMPVACCAALAFHAPALIPITIWAIVFGYLLMSEKAICDSSEGRLISKVLDNHIVRALGARSYSVYLIHWPLMFLAVDLERSLFALGPIAATFVEFFICVVSTLLLSELLYRFVERPGISVGHRLSQILEGTRSDPRVSNEHDEKNLAKRRPAEIQVAALNPPAP